MLAVLGITNQQNSIFPTRNNVSCFETVLLCGMSLEEASVSAHGVFGGGDGKQALLHPSLDLALNSMCALWSKTSLGFLVGHLVCTDTAQELGKEICHWPHWGQS